MTGTMLALELCSMGVPVLLLTRDPLGLPTGSGDMDGIAAELDFDPDHAGSHFEDSLRSGSALAPPEAVAAMVRAAPRLVGLLDQLGVCFARDSAGNFSRKAALGNACSRIFYAGLSTRQQVHAALSQQALRLQDTDLVDEHGHTIPGEQLLQVLDRWSFCRAVLDDHGVVVGAVARDMRTLRTRAWAADAVCLATGGFEGLFSSPTTSGSRRGGALGSVFRQGAILANLDLVQLAPLAIAGQHGARPLSANLLATGGQLWLPSESGDTRSPSAIPDKERSVVPTPRGDANNVARGILELLREGRGVPGVDATLGLLLDARRVEHRATTLPQELSAELGAIHVTPAIAGTLGGLWVDHDVRGDALELDSPRNHATSLSGLYAAGGAACAYAGSGLAEGNRLLSSLFGASLSARAIKTYVAALSRSALDLPGSIFEKAEAAEQSNLDTLLSPAEGEPEEAYGLLDRLRRHLPLVACVKPEAADLEALTEGASEIRSLIDRVRVSDKVTAMSSEALCAAELSSSCALVDATLCSIIERKGRSLEVPRWVLCRHLHGKTEIVNEVNYTCAGEAHRLSDSVASRGNLASSRAGAESTHAS